VRAFQRAAEALWEPGADDEKSQRDLRDAAFGLSLLMEDRRADVAMTARLWRAILFRTRGQEGDASRAYDLLPEELGPPVGDPSIALYLCILRERMFAERSGSLPAAIALSERLAVQVLGWFRDAGQAATARQTVVFLRRGLLRDWSAALRAAGKDARADWCGAAIQEIDRENFPTPASAELLPLAWAAPRIVALPEASAGASATDANTNGAADNENLHTPGMTTNGARGE